MRKAFPPIYTAVVHTQCTYTAHNVQWFKQQYTHTVHSAITYHFQFAEFYGPKTEEKQKHTYHKTFSTHSSFPLAHSLSLCLFSANSYTNKSIKPNILHTIHNVKSAIVCDSWCDVMWCDEEKKLRFSFALISSQGNFNALPIFTVSTHIIFSRRYILRIYLIWLFKSSQYTQTTTCHTQKKNTSTKLFTRTTAVCSINNIIYYIIIYLCLALVYAESDVKSYVCVKEIYAEYMCKST